MRSLAQPEASIADRSCLGGCGQGVVVKPIDPSIPAASKVLRRRVLDTIRDEAMAVAAAADLLTSINALDETAFLALSAKIAAGERALNNSVPPEVCLACGKALQLYRGNCAICGKNPY